MKFSSSLLDALIGGVFVFFGAPPEVDSHAPPKVAARVAIASCTPRICQQFVAWYPEGSRRGRR